MNKEMHRLVLFSTVRILLHYRGYPALRKSALSLLTSVIATSEVYRNVHHSELQFVRQGMVAA
jgi:hypothetical protein